MEEELGLASGVSLDTISRSLPAESFYLSPGGRHFLLAGALMAAVPRGARVLDVGCGMGPASIDLAEAFACRVTGFDDFAPYLAVAKLTAIERGVARLVTFRQMAGREPLAEFRHGAYDVVLGLGGSLGVTIPGGLEAGFAAAAAWLSVGGVLICGGLIAAATPSPLIETIFGGQLRTEAGFVDVLNEFGFDVIFASRASNADWVQLQRTMAGLHQRAITLPTPDNADLDRIATAAAMHPEVAFLNVVARRRPE